MTTKKTNKTITNAVQIGSLGGRASFKKLGKKGMSKIGKKGAEARWGKHKKLKDNK